MDQTLVINLRGLPRICGYSTYNIYYADKTTFQKREYKNCLPYMVLIL